MCHHLSQESICKRQLKAHWDEDIQWGELFPLRVAWPIIERVIYQSYVWNANKEFLIAHTRGKIEESWLGFFHECVQWKILQWSILVISSIVNYTSVLNAYLTNESLQACKNASKHSLQAVVSIILGFSYANADDIGVIIQQVKIKHMANHIYCCDQRYHYKIAHCLC